MGEEVEHDEGLLWDDQSWAFPNLEEGEEDCGIKSADKITNSEAADAKGKKRSSGGGGGGECEDHELHIWTERERRKKMRNMFSNLHALLPHIPPKSLFLQKHLFWLTHKFLKADKSTIVEEAVKYIKRVEQSVEELEKRKVERYKKLTIQSREAFIAEQGSLASPNPLCSGPEYEPIFKTWTSPNVILNICGRDAHMNVCSVRKPGLLAALCFVLEKHHLEVVTAQASAHQATCMYMIHARQSSGDQFQQPFPIEEIFKQAAAEIMLWVNS